MGLQCLLRFLLAYPILPYALLYFGSIAMALSQSFIASLKLLSLLWAAALRERWLGNEALSKKKPTTQKTHKKPKPNQTKETQTKQNKATKLQA